MDLKEFTNKYSKVGSKKRIDIICEKCNAPTNTVKHAAKNNITQNGFYKCRNCAMSENTNRNFTNESLKKISKATSYLRSDETKKKMSDAKKEFYKTDKGKALKRKLSRLAADGHAENRFENSKRNGWYESNKAGKVFYGSSYELRLCWELDNDDEVDTYETQIVYEGKNSSRCLDFLVINTDGSKRAVEVKPASRIEEQSNKSQIEDSLENAIKMGWGFEVYTENDFDMTEKELRDWADQFLTELGEFDWVGHRKELNRKKANKHYEKITSKDKVFVECDYCKKPHQVLRINYNKNIKKNGRYICGKEGGFIAGKKPKKKKVNPYASDGKKQCNKCKEVVLFELFDIDRSKGDGYATRCKACTSAAAKLRYEKRKRKN